MGRRKQLRPHRSVGILETNNSSEKLKDQDASKTKEDDEIAELEAPSFVEVDPSGWFSSEHCDISEVILTNLTLSREFYGYVLSEDRYWERKYSLRFRLSNVNEYLGRMKLGHWPVLSASNIYLEFIEKRLVEETETNIVLVAGSFDGPDEGVSGLVHLVNMKFLTLRPIMGVTLSESCPSLRVRVEILKSAFDACESLLDNTREVWRRSMLKIMAWLRPEIITSEARYGYSAPADVEFDLPMEIDESASALRKRVRFDAAGFYEAIKPSKYVPL